MKAIEITDEQYDLIQQQRERCVGGVSAVDVMQELMIGYARGYAFPPFTANEAFEAGEIDG
jgi:hypothetical protein